MHNSIFLEDNEVHLHRFLWPNAETGDIETYAILRVNIGDRPAACLSMLAVRLTAQLPEFTHLTKAVDTCLNSTYVDDVLDSADTPQEIENLKSDMQTILEKGCLQIKHWLTSGVKPDNKECEITLPNALKGDESTALGFGYLVEKDVLFVRGSVNFSKKIQKIHSGPNLTTVG